MNDYHCSTCKRKVGVHVVQLHNSFEYTARCRECGAQNWEAICRMKDQLLSLEKDAKAQARKDARAKAKAEEEQAEAKRRLARL